MIYTNGDSFTEGLGLSDYSVIAEYPGHFKYLKTDPEWSDPKYNAMKLEWVTLRSNILKDAILSLKYKKENASKAWPSRLADILKTDVINSAVGGASIFEIASKTLYDLNQLVNVQKIIPDRVLIGLTSNSRLSFIGQQVKSYAVYQLEDIPKKYQNYAKEYWGSHTDEEILTMYLYHCLTIKNTVKTLTGKDPVFLNTSFNFFQNKSIVDQSKIILLKDYWNQLGFDLVSDQPSIMDFATDEYQWTPCGHVTEEVHKKYAKHIAINYI